MAHAGFGFPSQAALVAAWGLVGEVDGLDWSEQARHRLAWVEQRIGS